MNIVDAHTHSIRRPTASVAAKPIDVDRTCRWVLALGFASVLASTLAWIAG